MAILSTSRVSLKANIFCTQAAEDENTAAHVWHKHYSLSYTEVLGKTSWIGQTERNWKIYKKNKSGQRARLSTDKTKTQTVVAGAYSEARLS